MNSLASYFRRFYRSPSNTKGKEGETHSMPKNSLGESASAAREYLAAGKFDDAYAAFSIAAEDNPENIEYHVGLALCYFHQERVVEAITILKNTIDRLGGHDAIFGLLVKCHLKSFDWKSLVDAWNQWRLFIGKNKTEEFFSVCGDIFVAGIDNDNLPEIMDDLLFEILYQPAETIHTEAHPVICAILFKHHEYNRHHYKKLLARIHKFKDQHGLNTYFNTTIATVCLSFGIAHENEKLSLIRYFFYKFKIFSHWSFILITSAWNEVWDTSLKNHSNLQISAKILEEEVKNINQWDPDFLIDILIFSDVCCRHVKPLIITNMKFRLHTNFNSSDYREDFVRISSNKLSSKNQLTFDRPLRIAVCISGQLRGYKKAFSTWDSLGLTGHSVTYIVHTWKNIGGDPPIPPKDVRVLSGNFLRSFHAACIKLGQDEMLARYPHFFALWSSDKLEASSMELTKLYGTNHVYIDDSENHFFNDFSNAQKMYYKIYKCHEAAMSIGIDFDLMIRIRPDWKFHNPCKINWKDVYLQASLENKLFVEHYPPYLFPHIGYCIGDQFSISTPPIMTGYASTYEKTLDRIKGVGPRTFPSNFLAHRNLAYSCLFSGINVQPIPMPVQFSPIDSPSSLDILSSIAKNSYDDGIHHDLLKAAALDANL